MVLELVLHLMIQPVSWANTRTHARCLEKIIREENASSIN